MAYLTTQERETRRLAYERFGDRLTEAFKLMRKLGLIARQNFSCCSGCAGNALGVEFGEMTKEKRAKVKGVAFYNKQDAASLRERGEAYLNFGQLTHCDAAGNDKYTSALDTVTVGYMVTTCLAQAGIPFEWDGNPDKRIVAKLYEIPYRLVDALERGEFAAR